MRKSHSPNYLHKVAMNDSMAMDVTVNNMVYKFCTAFSDSMYYVFFHNTLHL